MGYRSTFITDENGFEFSESFVEKYKDRYNFNLKNYDYRILAVWLHENGEIDRIVFTTEGVFDYEEWISNN